jgi:hypothetical protein
MDMLKGRIKNGSYRDAEKVTMILLQLRQAKSGKGGCRDTETVR